MDVLSAFFELLFALSDLSEYFESKKIKRVPKPRVVKTAKGRKRTTSLRKSTKVKYIQA